ncbi:hypothetical protein V2J09_010755, partial [Rumex salicifolius]
ERNSNSYCLIFPTLESHIESHAQNGSIENRHCHIVNTGLALLAQSSLPFKYWNYTFETTVYLINRRPSSVLTSPPRMTLLQKEPEYQFLKNFGCLCFPNLRPYNAHKLSYRSSSCTCAHMASIPLVMSSFMKHLTHLIGPSLSALTLLISLHS